MNRWLRGRDGDGLRDRHRLRDGLRAPAASREGGDREGRSPRSTASSSSARVPSPGSARASTCRRDPGDRRRYAPRRSPPTRRLSRLRRPCHRDNERPSRLPPRSWGTVNSTPLRAGACARIRVRRRADPGPASHRRRPLPARCRACLELAGSMARLPPDRGLWKRSPKSDLARRHRLSRTRQRRRTG